VALPRSAENVLQRHLQETVFSFISILFPVMLQIPSK